MQQARRCKADLQGQGTELTGELDVQVQQAQRCKATRQGTELTRELNVQVQQEAWHRQGSQENCMERRLDGTQGQSSTREWRAGRKFFPVLSLSIHLAEDVEFAHCM